MIADMILNIMLIAAGAVMVFCPYNKIKAVFPRAKSEILVKILGLVVMGVGVFAAAAEFFAS